MNSEISRAAVIMAGGSGTRFWPKSSQKLPKQFLSLVDKKSMIQLTRDRLMGVVQKKNISVVSPQSLNSLIKKHLGSTTKIIHEPEARNTMAAVCLAAWSFKNQETVLAVLPADAHIEDEKNYRSALSRCFDFASTNEVIVCLGITPTFSATAYGYIKVGAALKQSIYKIDKFMEKPSQQKAEELFRSGKYLWNAGIFVFKISTFKEQVRLHAPDYFRAFEKAKGQKAKLAKMFKSLPKEPLDTALMEKTQNGALIPGDFGWNDVGSWPALSEVLPSNDQAGLIKTQGEHVAIDSTGIIADMSSKKFLGLVGVHNLIIVETDDALLICSKDSAQEIKTLVAELQKNKNLKKLV